MEILAVLIVLAGGYLIWKKSQSTTTQTVEAEAPYKVETPAPVAEVAPTVAPQGDTTSGAGPAVEVQAKPTKAKKPKAPAKPKAAAITAKESKPKAAKKTTKLKVAK